MTAVYVIVSIDEVATTINEKKHIHHFFSRLVSSSPCLHFSLEKSVETFYLFNWTKNASRFVYLPNYLLFWLTPARSNARQSHKNESSASI